MSSKLKYKAETNLRNLQRIAKQALEMILNYEEIAVPGAL